MDTRKSKTHPLLAKMNELYKSASKDKQKIFDKYRDIAALVTSLEKEIAAMDSANNRLKIISQLVKDIYITIIGQKNVSTGDLKELYDELSSQFDNCVNTFLEKAKAKKEAYIKSVEEYNLTKSHIITCKSYCEEMVALIENNKEYFQVKQIPTLHFYLTSAHSKFLYQLYAKKNVDGLNAHQIQVLYKINSLADSNRIFADYTTLIKNVKQPMLKMKLLALQLVDCNEAIGDDGLSSEQFIILHDGLIESAQDFARLIKNLSYENNYEYLWCLKFVKQSCFNLSINLAKFSLTEKFKAQSDSFQKRILQQIFIFKDLAQAIPFVDECTDYLTSSTEIHLRKIQAKFNMSIKEILFKLGGDDLTESQLNQASDYLRQRAIQRTAKETSEIIHHSVLLGMSYYCSFSKKRNVEEKKAIISSAEDFFNHIDETLKNDPAGKHVYGGIRNAIQFNFWLYHDLSTLRRVSSLSFGYLSKLKQAKDYPGHEPAFDAFDMLKTQPTKNTYYQLILCDLIESASEIFSKQQAFTAINNHLEKIREICAAFLHSSIELDKDPFYHFNILRLEKTLFNIMNYLTDEDYLALSGHNYENKMNILKTALYFSNFYLSLPSADNSAVNFIPPWLIERKIFGLQQDHWVEERKEQAKLLNVRKLCEVQKQKPIIESELKQIRQNITVLEQALAKKHCDQEKSEIANKAQNSEMDKLIAEQESNDEAIKRLEEELRLRKIKAENLKRSIDTCQEKLASSTTHISETAAEVTKIEADITKNRKDAANLESQLKEKDKLLATLKINIKKLQSKPVSKVSKADLEAELTENIENILTLPFLKALTRRKQWAKEAYQKSKQDMLELRRMLDFYLGTADEALKCLINACHRFLDNNDKIWQYIIEASNWAEDISNNNNYEVPISILSKIKALVNKLKEELSTINNYKANNAIDGKIQKNFSANAATILEKTLDSFMTFLNDIPMTYHYLFFEAEQIRRLSIVNAAKIFNQRLIDFLIENSREFKCKLDQNISMQMLTLTDFYYKLFHNQPLPGIKIDDYPLLRDFIGVKEDDTLYAAVSSTMKHPLPTILMSTDKISWLRERYFSEFREDLVNPDKILTLLDIANKIELYYQNFINVLPQIDPQATDLIAIVARGKLPIATTATFFLNITQKLISLKDGDSQNLINKLFDRIFSLLWKFYKIAIPAKICDLLAEEILQSLYDECQSWGGMPKFNLPQDVEQLKINIEEFTVFADIKLSNSNKDIPTSTNILPCAELGKYLKLYVSLQELEKKYVAFMTPEKSFEDKWTLLILTKCRHSLLTYCFPSLEQLLNEYLKSFNNANNNRGSIIESARAVVTLITDFFKENETELKKDLVSDDFKIPATIICFYYDLYFNERALGFDAIICEQLREAKEQRDTSRIDEFYIKAEQTIADPTSKAIVLFNHAYDRCIADANTDFNYLYQEILSLSRITEQYLLLFHSNRNNSIVNGCIQQLANIYLKVIDALAEKIDYSLKNSATIQEKDSLLNIITFIKVFQTMPNLQEIDRLSTEKIKNDVLAVISQINKLELQKTLVEIKKQIDNAERYYQFFNTQLAKNKFNLDTYTSKLEKIHSVINQFIQSFPANPQSDTELLKIAQEFFVYCNKSKDLANKLRYNMDFPTSEKLSKILEKMATATCIFATKLGEFQVNQIKKSIKQATNGNKPYIKQNLFSERKITRSASFTDTSLQSKRATKA